jgi:hypothetical protein
MNYTELRTAIQDTAENDFSYSVDPSIIDRFIQQAETRIYNLVQFPALRKNVTGVTANGNKYLACPGDFLSVYSMAVILPTGPYEFLLNKDVNFIRAMYPNPATTGVPRYYALFGPVSNQENELTFILGPTPDAIYNLELHYQFYPETIVTAGNTWLGDNFDPVLFYGALVEAAVYMKQEPDLIAMYDGKFKEAVQLAARLGDGLEKTDAYRTGQIRVPFK